MLLANKADIDIKDKYGKTALIQACCGGPVHLEIVKILLTNGASLNIKEALEGQNALIWGKINKKTSKLKLIKIIWSI